MKFLLITETDGYDAGTMVEEIEFDPAKVTDRINEILKEYPVDAKKDFTVYLVQCEYEVIPKDIVKTVELELKNET